MSSDLAQREELRGQMPSSDGAKTAPSAVDAQGQGNGSSDAMMMVVEEAAVPTFREISLRPVFCLSVRLIDTYKHINKVYYDAKAKKLLEQSEANHGRNGVKNNGYDNANYDYIVQNDSGEIFNDRYIVKHKLGKGSFGQVYCAYDQTTGSEVAIKIIKSRRPFTNQAQIEIELLRRLKDNDPHDDMHVVHLLDAFMHHEHQCLVFEMMSYNLYDLLKNTRFKGVSLNLIRKFARQILKALEYLARPDINIIHCDLKPENVLLKHPRRSAIKLIDFGSSCYFSKKTYSYIQSRFYRSPEILLGTMNYSQKIDMWSLGCVLVEMHTGEPLFGGSDALDQITRIVLAMGQLPYPMVAESKLEVQQKFFVKVDDFRRVPLDESEMLLVDDPQGNLGPDGVSPARVPVLAGCDENTGFFLRAPPPSSDKAAANAKRVRSLADIIGVYTDGPMGRRRGEPGHTVDDYLMFHDLIKKMLIYDPDERISPTEALQCPFMLAGTHAAQGDNTQASTDQVASSATNSAPAATHSNHPSVHHHSASGEASHTAAAVPDTSTMETTGDDEKIGNRRSLRPSSAPSSLSQQTTKRRINEDTSATLSSSSAGATRTVMNVTLTSTDDSQSHTDSATATTTSITGTWSGHV